MKIIFPEEFLELIEDCRAGITVSDTELLLALPSVLTQQASKWYRTTKSSFRSWKDFKKGFKNQYIGDYDKEDLMEDLRNRSQGAGETVTEYLTSLRYILLKFTKPPSRKCQVELAYRNLLPEYRRAMSEKIIETYDDIERYGRKWERQLELDGRYKPPPPPEKMKIKGAAFIGGNKVKNSQKKNKISSISEELAAVNSAKNFKNTNDKKERINKNQKGEMRNKEQGESRIEKENEGIENDKTAAINNHRPFSQNNFVNQNDYQRQNKGNDLGNHNQSGKFNQFKERGDPEPLTVCFLCQAVGHKAPNCPEVICYSCNERGHMSRGCPNKARIGSDIREIPTRINNNSEISMKNKEECQVCGRSRVVFKNCSSPICEEIKRRSGNL